MADKKLTIRQVAIHFHKELHRKRRTDVEPTSDPLVSAAVVADFMRDHRRIARTIATLVGHRLVPNADTDPRGELADLQGLIEHYAVKTAGEGVVSPPVREGYIVRGACWCPGCDARLWRATSKTHGRARGTARRLAIPKGGLATLALASMYLTDDGRVHPWPCNRRLESP